MTQRHLNHPVDSRLRGNDGFDFSCYAKHAAEITFGGEGAASVTSLRLNPRFLNHLGPAWHFGLEQSREIFRRIRYDIHTLR